MSDSTSIDSQSSGSALSLLDDQAFRSPAKDFLLSSRGREYTYEEFRAAYLETAAKLYGVGIESGEVIPTLLPNSAETVEVWFSLIHLGAVWNPINTEFRGEQLKSALSTTKARTLIVHPEYMELLASLEGELPSLMNIVVWGKYSAKSSRLRPELIFRESLPSSLIPQRVSRDSSSVGTIQFTSGSSGLSKAVQLPYGYMTGQGALVAKGFGLKEDDVLYCPFPLYHWDATAGTVMAALSVGATAAIAERFSVSRFWDEVRAFNATVFDFMGATLSFLYAQPESPSDRQNSIRIAWGVPMPDFKEDFEARFGLSLLEAYGSTEGGVYVFQNEHENYPTGSCGKVMDGFEIKIVSDDGVALPVGEVGEIATKPTVDKCQSMVGYFGMDDVNKELIKDGWYHTGDLGQLDSNGFLYFEGRKKDVIRRRGENISPLEIEVCLKSHPCIDDAAAFGVPSPHTEEEVAVAIVCEPGHRLTEKEIQTHCSDRLAKYMVPEFVFFTDELPRTPTSKVAKAKLRERFVVAS